MICPSMQCREKSSMSFHSIGKGHSEGIKSTVMNAIMYGNEFVTKIHYL